MSETDDLRAETYDLEDELVCLEAELMLAERDDDEETVSMIEDEIDSILWQMSLVREDLIELERTNG